MSLIRRIGVVCFVGMVLSGSATLSAAEIPAYCPMPTTVPAEWTSNRLKPAEIRLPMSDGTTLSPSDVAVQRSLNDKQWRFSGVVNSTTTDDADLNAAAYQPTFDDSAWDTIAVPLNWYVQYPRAYIVPEEFSKPYFKGIYRCSITLSQADLANRRVVLHFGVIGYEATLYVNGKVAGTHHGDFVPWDVDVTPFVQAGANTLAIRVVSDFALTPAVHTYGSNWARNNIKAGLWQEAFLRLEPAVRISRVLITPDLKGGGVAVDAQILNHTDRVDGYRVSAVVSSAWKNAKEPINVSMEFPATKLVGGENAFRGFVKMKNPICWTPTTPELYYLTLIVRDADGKIVSAMPVRFGYREFKSRGRNFVLNGERIYLFGENWPVVNQGGKGVDVAVEAAEMEKDLRSYKAYGVNILRTSHMPALPIFYDLADELGMMVFDEWSWSFTSSINEPEFAKRNDRELTEWVIRDYNHPSVVMWSCGNEVPHDDPAIHRQLNRQVDQVHAIDKSGRPVSSFSGSACLLTYGKEKLTTDVLDMHNYIGMGVYPWTWWEPIFHDDYIRVAKTYARTEKEFAKPFVIWECVGFTWGWHTKPDFKQNDVRAYAEYVANEDKSNWGEHYGIGLAGSLGLHTALTKSVYVGREPYGRRILGLIRQNSDVQGFGPWFSAPGLPQSTLWNQPVYCGLRNTQGIPPRNVFYGQTVDRTLFIVNSSNENYKNVSVEIGVARVDGSVQKIREVTIGAVNAWQHRTERVSMTMPQGTTAEHAQLRVTVRSEGCEISRNFHELFLQNPAIMTTAIASPKTTAVLNCSRADEVKSIVTILKSLGVEAKVVDAQKGDFAAFDVLIVPPTLQKMRSPINEAAILDRVRAGARLLVLEQSEGTLPMLAGYRVVQPGGTFVDLVIPAHPVFNTLSQAEFDTWECDDLGCPVSYAITPFSLNAIAVRGPILTRKGVAMAMMEATLEKGRIVSSQFNACKLWGKDSAATTTLANLLDYVIGSSMPLYDKAEPLVAKADRGAVSDPSKLVTIDLRAYANRDFVDRTAEGGADGWTAQGSENDLRAMPVGRQSVGAVVFEIIDPAKNDQRAALILRGSDRPKFPASIDGIKLGGTFKRLFFLHGCAWNPGGEAGRYRFHYADGQTAEMTLVEGRNTGDWWNVRDMSEAWSGMTVVNGVGHTVGLFVAEWKNPRPEVAIESMDFLSARAGDETNFSSAPACVPFLVAVTGER